MTRAELEACFQANVAHSVGVLPLSIHADAKQFAGIMLLQFHHKMVTIISSSMFETSQMVYDRYRSDFEDMLSLAERLIRGSQTTGFGLACLNMGVLAPLFFVALKCRDLVLRRKAVALLKLSPRREGIWSRTCILQYSEWKIEMEERGRGSLPETSPLPESARIYGERAKNAVAGGERVTVVSFRRVLPNGTIPTETEEEITELGAEMDQLL